MKQSFLGYADIGVSKLCNVWYYRRVSDPDPYVFAGIWANREQFRGKGYRSGQNVGFFMPESESIKKNLNF